MDDFKRRKKDSIRCPGHTYDTYDFEQAVLRNGVPRAPESAPRDPTEAVSFVFLSQCLEVLSCFVLDSDNGIRVVRVKRVIITVFCSPHTRNIGQAEEPRGQ